jgi:Rad3-related DNA helicase
MATVTQQAGRGNRAVDDSVTVYILDEQVNKIYTSRPSLWSKSFRNQVSWTEAPWDLDGNMIENNS